MDIKEEKPCRLCLNDAETEFEIIDEITRNMLDHLLLIMDLDVSENPIMCQNCSETLKRFYNFKSICDGMSTSIKKEPRFESADVEEGTSINKNSSICGFCTNPNEGHNVVPMDVLTDEPVFEELLPIIMPGMDRKVLTDTLICTDCKDDLLHYVKFVQNCGDTERKINTYRHHKGTNSDCKVNLSNVQCSLIADSSEYSDNCAVKLEPYNNFQKQEVLDIKDEAYRLDEYLLEASTGDNDVITKVYECASETEFEHKEINPQGLIGSKNEQVYGVQLQDGMDLEP